MRSNKLEEEHTGDKIMKSFVCLDKKTTLQFTELSFNETRTTFRFA